MVGWYDISAASAYCCTGKRTIETWIKEKSLRVSRIRGKRLIKRQWLDEFLEAHEQTNNENDVSKIVDGVLADLT